MKKILILFTLTIIQSNIIAADCKSVGDKCSVRNKLGICKLDARNKLSCSTELVTNCKNPENANAPCPGGTCGAGRCIKYK